MPGREVMRVVDIFPVQLPIGQVIKWIANMLVIYVCIWGGLLSTVWFYDPAVCVKELKFLGKSNLLSDKGRVIMLWMADGCVPSVRSLAGWLLLIQPSSGPRAPL